MRAFFSFSMLLAACSGAVDTADASMDAASRADSAAVDAAPDASRECLPACSDTQICCAGDDGLLCRNRRSDVEHCGVCGMDCVGTQRGDACNLGVCVCGGAGGSPCTGMADSICCPPRAPGLRGYCADLTQSGSDCGSCNFACDGRRSDRCDGGNCVCGDARTQCEGTPTSRCCALSPVEAGCVDITTHSEHCGACGLACFTGERCAQSTCTRGAAECTGGCAAPNICCDGRCCTRRACAEGACGP